MTTVEEPEPTHCKNCGTELQPGVVDLAVCPNPDCSGSGNDVTPMTEGESERWLNQPGTEGGANGGG